MDGKMERIIYQHMINSCAKLVLKKQNDDGKVRYTVVFSRDGIEGEAAIDAENDFEAVKIMDGMRAGIGEAVLNTQCNFEAVRIANMMSNYGKNCGNCEYYGKVKFYPNSDNKYCGNEKVYSLIRGIEPVLEPPPGFCCSLWSGVIEDEPVEYTRNHPDVRRLFERDMRVAGWELRENHVLSGVKVAPTKFVLGRKVVAYDDALLHWWLNDGATPSGKLP